MKAQRASLWHLVGASFRFLPGVVLAGAPGLPIFFVHHVAQLVQADTALALVSEDLSETIDAVFAARTADAAPDEAPDEALAA